MRIKTPKGHKGPKIEYFEALEAHCAVELDEATGDYNYYIVMCIGKTDYMFGMTAPVLKHLMGDAANSLMEGGDFHP